MMYFSKHNSIIKQSMTIYTFGLMIILNLKGSPKAQLQAHWESIDHRARILV